MTAGPDGIPRFLRSSIQSSHQDLWLGTIVCNVSRLVEILQRESSFEGNISERCADLQGNTNP